MHFRSLESRIVTLFLVLILAVQLAGFFAIRTGIQNNALASIHAELMVGERMFLRLLKQNADKLTDGARILAKDYGFLSAIGTTDRETIMDALLNTGERIGASLMVLVGPDRKIQVATTVRQTGKTDKTGKLEESILKLVETAEQTGSASGTSISGNHLYQIVVLPVKAPVIIGWVAMAFPIDQQLAADMRDLSSLHVSVLNKDTNGEWIPDASTLPAQDASSLAQQLHGLTGDTPKLQKLRIGDSDFSAHIVPLATDAGQTALIVLQRSITEAVAPYQQLQVTLLVLTAIGIIVAVVGSFFTARRITGPLRRLSEVAKLLGQGNYQGQIKIDREDEIGDLSNAFESMRDGIATRELQIRRLAYWDTLTGLPNRAQFTDLLNQAIEQAKQYDGPCSILMMDLDRFKNVNDVLGHSFGDALLCQVAERLKQQIDGHADHVARLGGDEFAILLINASIDKAQTAAARILESLEEPISLEEQTVDMGSSIGIASFPDHGADAQVLLSHAEVAMYAAKNSGRGAAVYDPAIDKGSQQSLSLLSDMRRALDRNEFRLYVQPKVVLKTGKVTGLEALVRWVHPDKGLIFPDNFIPFAEQTGFIRLLTLWMLDKSAALCKTLQEKDIHPKISVNLSTRDLLDQDLPAKFAEILTRYQVTSSSFCLEITESAIMDDPLRAQQTLEGLHIMGADLAIDDFGTGYSSLAYLKRLPVDELKIDKSFVMKMEHDTGDVKIVRSTIDLGHNMGLRVVAEGIENEAVWSILSAMQCDQGQGYFISKPIPAEQFAGWLERWTPPSWIMEPDASLHE